MTPDEYKRLKDVFFDIRELPADAQEARVREIEASDPSMGTALRRLMAASSTNDDFLNEAALPELQPTQALRDSGLPPASIPSTIGPYAVVERLGSGGMGIVYKAHDARLDRYVALKVLRLGTHESIQRLFQEARSQARVEHEGICKVYEVAEAGDEPYIAMQLIEGRTLDAAARDMCLDEKLHVMRRVAEALHAAHRLGLVHRDIKPSNVMVERSEEQGWKPYITDFGLAREVGAPGLTQSGTVMGTPQYMAPEQLRGDSQHLDRRTDVYALGATLYELLGGKPPFVGESSITVLMKVLHEEAPSLNTLDSGIPPDLDAITMKCLEKEQRARYDSAKALADDIGRYLDGEPVTARRLTRLRRFARKVAKHHVVAAIVATAIVASVAAGSWGLSIKWQASRGVAIAQELGQQVREIEAAARYAHMAGTHDIRDDYARIEKRMESIRSRVETAGSYARGPGLYALGRGEMILGRLAEARRNLELAWDSGYRAPEVAYSLGLALGEIYWARLQETDRIRDRFSREAERERAARELLIPAKDYIKRALGSIEEPAYAEGLLALYEKRYEAAMTAARTARQRAAWLYESWKLEGDVYKAEGDEANERGDYQLARSLYEKAESAYAKAAEDGESDARVFEAIGSLSHARMTLEWHGPGGDVQPFFESGEKAVRTAMQIHADRDAPYAILAKLNIQLARARLRSGLGPEERFAAAIEAAEAAVQRNEQNLSALVSIAIAHADLADYCIETGRDPRPALDAARGPAKKALHVNPADLPAASTLGYSYFLQAQYEVEKSVDPRGSLQRAEWAFRYALRINPRYRTAWVNLGGVHGVRGDYEQGIGQDPTSSYERAIDALEESVSINPNDVIAHHNMGVARSTIGEYQLRQGLDPRKQLDLAIKCAQQSLSIDPGTVYPYGTIGLANLTHAEYERRTANDPVPWLQEAVKAVEKGIEVNPGYHHIRSTAAFAYIRMAECLIERGDDPAAWNKKARDQLVSSRKLNSSNPWVSNVSCDVASIQLKWRIASGLDPRTAFESAVREHRNAAAAHPREASIRRSWARVCMRFALWQRDGPGVTRSVKVSSDAVVAQGIEQAEEALRLDPRDPETVAILGGLHLSRAEEAQEASEAARLLAKALEMNKTLNRDYGRLLELARAESN